MRPLPHMLLLSVLAPPHGEEILLVDALRRLGARSVERQGERYVALIAPPFELEPLLREAQLVIRASTSLREPSLTWEWHSPEDWAEVWNAAVEPRRIGERFVVAPSERTPASAPSDLIIRLVPGVGFGTAEHATTRACLHLLERWLRPGDRIVDVGSGSGILAIAAALLGAEHVLALEMDPYACDAARANLLANAVDGRVELREVEVGPGTLHERAAFDGVTANLRTDLLVVLLPHLAYALTGDGWLIASGVPGMESGTVIRAASDSGLWPAEERVEDGWWAACLRRTSPLDP